jgi:diguanylate cyclase (GGDEF)-like protein
MITFGIIVGLIFPPFARVVLDSDRALSAAFFIMCVMAGLLVGLVNYQLFRTVVSKELSRLVSGMKSVLDGVAAAEYNGGGCGTDCLLEVTSNDAIGQIELSFNDMTLAIERRLTIDKMNQQLHTRISASVELEDVSRTILTLVADMVEAKAGMIYGDTGETFELLADFGIDYTDEVPRTISKDLGPIGHAINTGEILILSTEEDGLKWIKQSTPLGNFRPRRLLVVPLMENQRAVGIVITACKSETINEDKQLIVENLRTQGAPYLQNAMLHRKIRDLAALDDLTMILNRRFGIRRLQEEFSRSVRHGVPVSVLMIDIDHFKTFNDTFGHDAGDVVLKKIASTLDANLRSGDVICRYGGEEFMVVAPGTGLNDAAGLAERMRRIIETNRVVWGQQSLAVTVSMGVATWPIERASISEELITAADRALYSAKESGRNRIAITRNDEVFSAFELEEERSQVVGQK